MRGFPVFILLGGLVVGGVLPAVAQSNVKNDPGPPAQLVDVNASTDRSTYTQRAGHKVKEWKQKLVQFGKKAKTKGSDVGNAAGDDLHDAWTKTEAASERLRTATAEDWESAKLAFEAASHDLSDRWRTINHVKK